MTNCMEDSPSSLGCHCECMVTHEEVDTVSHRVDWIEFLIFQ